MIYIWEMITVINDNKNVLKLTSSIETGYSKSSM